ncbi:hypothetical protein IQ254_27680 [Nodosilinea sp. LEGE 07088]|uniref:hypothetical protein n=1 Tax=Nodosilinea sp. LEGE 07088 TaxID=2777968 RepID=UPI00188052DA|nr:hypothetical protein [Nodosilinea sp. LEGE 07088]MBE9140935.1 hypothetical protein [Nodosilinea sp. LEGE 07088]
MSEKIDQFCASLRQQLTEIEAKLNYSRLKFFALAVIPAVVACGGPTVEDAEAGLCDDLNGFATALQNLGQLNAQSTVNDLETARSDLAKAYESVKASAATVEEARLNELDTAYTDFETTVSSISGRDTLGEAAITVAAESANVAAARQQLSSGLSCP